MEGATMKDADGDPTAASQGKSMSIGDQFRARALECEDLAEKAKDPAAKCNFQEAARGWRNIAEIEDQLSGQPPDPKT